MKTPIKGLNENQNKIVNDLISEFKTINNSEKTIELSIIDSIFAESEKYIKDKTEFYNEISSNNERVMRSSYIASQSLINKLKLLFKNYPRIELFVSSNSVRISFKETNFKGCFWINFETLLARNEFGTISWHFDNDARNPNVTKYLDYQIKIGGEIVTLDSFETSKNFKKQLKNLIISNPE